jgi:serine/threonine-protein kinase
VLPGSRAVVFTVRRSALVWGREEIALQRLDRDERVRVLDRGADARYVATGHLLFADFGSLAAVPFDLGTLTVTGPAVPLVGHVAQALNEAAREEDTGAGQFAASSRGDLVHLRREGGIAPSARHVLAWMGLDGRVTPLPVEPRHYLQPRLSPDGTRIATIVRDLASVDLWLYDLRRSAWTPLTEDADVQGFAWSPDGRELVLADRRRAGVLAARAGAPVRELVRTEGVHLLPSSWSPGGQVALVTGRDAAHLDVALLGLRDPVPALSAISARTAVESFAEHSPDGRWLAYVSAESRQDEVYVRPAAGPGERTRVSVGGGSNPLWRPDGRAIYFATRRGGGAGVLLQAADVEPRGDALRVGPARAVLTLPDVELGRATNGWDITPDGTRFLVVLRAPAEAPPELTRAEYRPGFGTVLQARVRAAR